MRFRVLGSLEVRRGDAVVPVGGRAQRLVLAALLVEAGTVVSVDALADVLWGRDPPAEPRNAVQTYVARLRAALGDGAIVTRAPGYVLEVDPGQVDALHFEQLLDAALRRRQEPAAVVELLDRALGLWRGPAYAEFADGVARTEALRLAEQRLVATEERAAARLALGGAEGLVAELGALVGAHPLRERLVELHMQALAVADRQAEALAVYRAYRERLADETGLEPSPAIGVLEGRIVRGELARSVPAGHAPPTAGGHAEPAGPTPALPAALTSLVGRQQQIGDTSAAIATHQVVTLTGTGGVGKTRVAAEVARAAHRDGGREVAWVELAPVADPAAVEYVVAAALGVELDGARPRLDALLDALTARTLLLVLDNCEHLLDTIAPLVDQVQRCCPQVHVLATSRERLAIDGEWVLPVPPLAAWAASGDAGAAQAVQLFLERAGPVAGGRDLSGNVALVAEICRQLDGLPLAIELAAARTGALSLEDLLDVLGEGAPTALGRRRGRAARHRDLGAVVEWSYRLLDDAEQALFAQLSVFAGAFGIEEAHAVCAPDGQRPATTREQVAGLAERSLLSGPLTGPRTAGRYRMLRPIRACARQLLAERGLAADAADRHAAVLVACAERAAGPPLTEHGRRWLEASLDDLRAAHRRAHETGDAALLCRLVAALYRFDYWRPGVELIGWADEALALPGVDDLPTAPAVHAAAAAAAWMRGDLDRAHRLAHRGTRLGADPDAPGRLLAFEALADVMFFEGALDEGEAAFREVVRLARLGGDVDGEVNGLVGIALGQAYRGHVAEAVAGADAADRVAVRAGPAMRAFARYARGECRAETGQPQAVELLDEAIGLARDCGAWFVEGVARLTAASLRGRHGDPADALPDFADLLQRWRRSGNWTQQWTTLRNLAELLARLEVDEPAVVIASAAEVEQTASPSFGHESERVGRALAAARTRLGEQRYEAARRRGQQMTGHAVVELAFTTLRDVAPADAPGSRG